MYRWFRVFPPKIPSQVSANPSSCIPPVINIPIVRANITEINNGIFKKRARQKLIKIIDPIITPQIGKAQQALLMVGIGSFNFPKGNIDKKERLS